MTKPSDTVDISQSDVDGGSIDFDRLDVIEERFSTDERFIHIKTQPEFAPSRIICVYNDRFYPQKVQTARLDFERDCREVHPALPELMSSGCLPDVIWQRHEEDEQ